MKICQMCGKELQPEVKPNTRYCPDCKKKAAKISTEKHKSNRTIPCTYCGRPFVTVGGRKYCSEACRRDVLKDPLKRKDPAEHCPKMTIEELAVMAAAHGTSYGKLVGRMEGRK